MVHGVNCLSLESLASQILVSFLAKNHSKVYYSWWSRVTLVLSLNFKLNIISQPSPKSKLNLVLKELILKNDRNGSIWQSGISKSLAVCPAPCVLCQCTVIFAGKCRLFCLCAHEQCHVCYIYHVEFHFWFRRLVLFTV